MSLILIYQQCFQTFQAKRGEHYVIVESMPIAYFGDLCAYQKSEKRIITVGLNPSSQEFPSSNPYLRFPNNNYQQLLENEDYKLYEKLLCKYYQESPYLRWFNSFKAILKGLNASYLDSSELPNRVLHTDICSPVPTDPTWNNLSKSDKNKLLQDGQEIWHSLVEILQPHLILISVAECYLKSIKFERTTWDVIHTIANSQDGILRNRPYEVKLAQLQISHNFKTHICFGRAANTPFGLISNIEKFTLGQNLLTRL
jgi:hypothetical protein